MAKVSHKQRIIDLIELNKSDVEIKKTIYNEYNIVVKLGDIEAKRNTNYIIEFKENKNQEIDDKIKLVKEILNANNYNPLTKKEIVNKIYAQHQVYLTQIEIKEILWTRLKNEIVYDKDEWTYKLKNKNLQNNGINDLSNFDKLEKTNEKTVNFLFSLDNPINSINLILDLLKNSKIIEDKIKVDDYLKKIIFEINKIKILINQSNYLENDNEKQIPKENIINTNFSDYDTFINILKEEKYRLGSPVVNQFVENVTKRIKDLK